MQKTIFLWLVAWASLAISCDPFHTKIETEDETVQYYEAKEKEIVLLPKSNLIIATWNIKFGGGRIDFFFDCHGDRVLMNSTEVKENMQGVVAKIRQMNPDVILLQEVDIDAKRSAYLDQVQYLLDHTALNYGVYASQWKADYVPSDGVGQMNSGNAILSKFPLQNAERIALPLIGEQSALVQYFYLRRNILQADISVENKAITLFNTHTSAYSTDNTKQLQLEKIKELATAKNNAGKAFILGGDFNNLPPNTTKYCHFEDEICAESSDYAARSCTQLAEELSNMNIFAEYDAAIPQAIYESNQTNYATFTSDKNGFWNRKLDYIYTNRSFVPNKGLVHQNMALGGMETMPLSDHAPVSAVYPIHP